MRSLMTGDAWVHYVPFDDRKRLWDTLFADARVPRTLVTSPAGRQDNCRQQAMALPAVFSAEEPDPLRAALDALWAGAAAFGRDRHRELFAEVRQAFPGLVTG